MDKNLRSGRCFKEPHSTDVVDMIMGKNDSLEIDAFCAKVF
jgi:hypothetical protein